jgi:hypothetical protein
MKVKKAEAQFTPGPWAVGEDYGKLTIYGAVPENDKFPVVAQWLYNCNAAMPKSVKENAALISAAPELLNACQMAVNEMPGNEQGQKIASMLRAAIAKAEGK